MPTALDLIDVLRGWLGMTEDPTHSNQTPIGAAYGWNGVPWCAETVSVAHKRVGLNDLWTASVSAAISSAKAGNHGLSWVPRGDTIRAGDHSTFDWGGAGNPNQFHISTVIDPGTQTKFRTIGGNENDAVTDQWRDRTYVQGFIRPAYDAPPPPPPAPPPSSSDTLRHGETLARGQSMFSSNSQYMLVLQYSDGHLVLYDVRDPASYHALWSTSTTGADRLVMQDDDNLVTYAGTHALWASGTAHSAGTGHARLVVQNDNNLVVYTDANRPVWSRR